MELVCAALMVYTIILFIRIILSWVQMGGARISGGFAPIVKIIYDLTEPVLGFFRRIIPPFGPLDLSPLFVFLIIGFVQRSLC
ncbi:MAG TPA: YggT family protein [Actinomycetota bacterium]|nr:YggT family protein [Actinomycetota bacterium]